MKTYLHERLAEASSRTALGGIVAGVIWIAQDWKSGEAWALLFGGLAGLFTKG
jgi:hypothetical protein